MVNGLLLVPIRARVYHRAAESGLMDAVPPEFHDLFEKRTFAHLTTLLPDDSPHTVPVWIDFDGGDLLVNTTRGSRKERNVRRDGRVSLSMLDPDDPHRFLSVRGTVAETTEEGAREHVDALARRYLGRERYDGDGSTRVLLRIRPEHAVAREV